MEVRIGGKGHPVVGRVVLKAAPGVHVDWRQNQPATMVRTQGFNPLQKRVGQDPHQYDQFAASLDKDGRFQVDDVPPGHYELTVTIDGTARPNQVGPGNALGQVKVLVDVPEGDDDAPVNLGEIKAEVKGR